MAKKTAQKYGKKNGTEIWKKRQIKWTNSLRNSNYNGRDRKDSKTINFFKIKFGDKWIENYISSITFSKKSQIYYLLSFRTYKEMIDALIEYNYRYSKTKRLISPVIIQEYYSCNFEEMETYLNNNYGVNPKKSFDYYKKLYPDTWLEIAINSETYKDKKIVKKLLSFCSYQDMIDYMVGKFGVTFIVQKLKNKIFSFYYGTNFKDMFNYLVSKDVYIAAKFGHMRHFNGHLCRSDGEFILANFLKENDILYEYERKYPNSNKRCDFYLIDVNFYVEFTGMVKFTEKNDAYESKKRFCLENDLNHLFSNNIDQIKKKITELYEIND